MELVTHSLSYSTKGPSKSC